MGTDASAYNIPLMHKGRARAYLGEWRKHRKLTQDQVAEHLGKSQPQISRFESGEDEFTGETLEILAKLYKCRPQDLFAPPDSAKGELDRVFERLDPSDQVKVIRMILAIAGEEGT